MAELPPGTFDLVKYGNPFEGETFGIATPAYEAGIGLGAGLGLGASVVGAGWSAYEVYQAKKEGDAKRAGFWGGVGTGIITGAGIGAGIGALGAGVTAIPGAAIGGIAGGIGGAFAGNTETAKNVASRVIGVDGALTATMDHLKPEEKRQLGFNNDREHDLAILKQTLERRGINTLRQMDQDANGLSTQELERGLGFLAPAPGQPTNTQTPSSNVTTNQSAPSNPITAYKNPDGSFIAVMPGDKTNPIKITRNVDSDKISDAEFAQYMKSRIGNPDDIKMLARNLRSVIANTLPEANLDPNGDWQISGEMLQQVAFKLGQKAKNEKLPLDQRAAYAMTVGNLGWAAKNVDQSKVDQKSVNEFMSVVQPDQLSHQFISAKIMPTAMIAKKKPSPTHSAAKGDDGKDGESPDAKPTRKDGPSGSLTSTTGDHTANIQALLRLDDAQFSPVLIDGIKRDLTDAGSKAYLEKLKADQDFITKHNINLADVNSTDRLWGIMRLRLQDNKKYRNQLSGSALAEMDHYITARDAKPTQIKLGDKQEEPVKAAQRFMNILSKLDLDPNEMKGVDLKVIDGKIDRKGPTENAIPKLRAFYQRESVKLGNEDNERKAQISQERLDLEKQLAAAQQAQQDAEAARMAAEKRAAAAEKVAANEAGLIENLYKQIDAKPQMATTESACDPARDIWMHSLHESGFFPEDDKAAKLGKKYCDMMNDSGLSLAEMRRGFIHIESDGHIIVVRASEQRTFSGQPVVLAYDISAHIRDKKLAGIETVRLSKPSLTEAAADLNAANEHLGGRLDKKIGTLKDMYADRKHGLDKPYQVHARIENGHFVASVIPERVHGQNPALYSRAFEQTPPFIHERTTHIDNLDNPDLLDGKRDKIDGHKYKYSEIHNLVAPFEKAANGDAKGAYDARHVIPGGDGGMMMAINKDGSSNKNVQGEDNRPFKERYAALYLKGGDVAKSIDDLQKLKDAHQENSDVYKNIINQVNTLSGAQQTRPIVPASR